MQRSMMILTGLLAWFVAAVPVHCDEPVPDKAKIEKLVRQLGDGDFDAREKATEELTKLGEPARAALESAQRSDDLEVRNRAKSILDELDKRVAKQKLDQKLAALRKSIAPPDFDATKVKELVEKNGLIKANETWKADRSYHVKDSLRVARGATLTLAPGVIVLLDEKAQIEVDAGAALVAVTGRTEPPILFTATAERDKKEGH